MLSVCLVGCYRPTLTEADKFFIDSVTESSIAADKSVEFVSTADNLRTMRMTLRKCKGVFKSLWPDNEDHEYCTEFVDSAERIVNNVEHATKVTPIREPAI